MAVLISGGGALGGPGGGERRCCATCHNANPDSPCDCICGGRYHGCGSFERAVEMHTDDWLAGQSDLPPEPLDQPTPALFARA